MLHGFVYKNIIFKYKIILLCLLKKKKAFSQTDDVRLFGATENQKNRKFIRKYHKLVLFHRNYKIMKQIPQF
jgi:hypothetical protein